LLVNTESIGIVVLLYLFLSIVLGVFVNALHFFSPVLTDSNLAAY